MYYDDELVERRDGYADRRDGYTDKRDGYTDKNDGYTDKSGYRDNRYADRHIGYNNRGNRNGSEGPQRPQRPNSAENNTRYNRQRYDSGGEQKLSNSPGSSGGGFHPGGILRLVDHEILRNIFCYNQ